MQKTINLAPIVFTVAVTAGVLFHDMHIDKAATVAFALPAVLASYGAANMVSGNEHVHVERASFSNQSIFHSGLPKVTNRDHEHRYIQAKKAPLSSGNNELWPSV